MFNSTAARLAATPVPSRMSCLPVDKRGYPVPWIVMRDKHGTPKFTINDDGRVQDCIQRRRCGICGQPHDPSGLWFVGGPRCFLHPQGAFLDPPMHRECADYALKVCPYIAAPNWTNEIGLTAIRPEDVPDHTTIITADAARSIESNPNRPDLFMLGKTNNYQPKDVGGHTIMVPNRAWKWLCVWRHGVMLGQDAWRIDNDTHDVVLISMPVKESA